MASARPRGPDRRHDYRGRYRPAASAPERGNARRIAPQRTPAAVIRFLQDELEKVYADPVVRERLSAIGLDPVWMPAPQLAQAIATDGERWARVIKAANIRAE